MRDSSHTSYSVSSSHALEVGNVSIISEIILG